MVGAADVLFVLLALDLLHIGEPGAAVLAAGLGAGTIVGRRPHASRLVGRSRLAAVAAGGADRWGIALAITAADRHGLAGAVARRDRWGRSGHPRHRGSDDAPAVGPRRGPVPGLRTPGRLCDVRARRRARSWCRCWCAAVGLVGAVLAIGQRSCPWLVRPAPGATWLTFDRRSVVPVRGDRPAPAEPRLFRPLARPAARGRGRRARPG